MSVSLPPRGRGTASNPHNRFAPTRSQAEDDGWFQDETPPCRATEVRAERAKTVLHLEKGILVERQAVAMA